MVKYTLGTISWKSYRQPRITKFGQNRGEVKVKMEFSMVQYTVGWVHSYLALIGERIGHRNYQTIKCCQNYSFRSFFRRTIETVFTDYDRMWDGRVYSGFVITCQIWS